MPLDQQACPPDLTDEPWKLVEPLEPAIAPDAASHVPTRRDNVHTILSILGTLYG